MAAKNKKQFATLHDLLILKLRSLYDIETQIVVALPKMIKAASDSELSAAFDKHLGETENHVKRLEEALGDLDQKVTKEKVEAIRGLVKDASWVIKTIKDDAPRDALLISAAQYVEHYEMAGYGSAREWADLMGHKTIAELLQSTLDEEKAADKKLNDLAVGGINSKANAGMTPMEKLAG
jgi:ferritin-like metal-binding protein YciE